MSRIFVTVVANMAVAVTVSSVSSVMVVADTVAIVFAGKVIVTVTGPSPSPPFEGPPSTGTTE